MLPGDRFNGIIDVGNSEGTLGITPRKHDANRPAFSTAFGGQCLALTGWGGCSFNRHAKALPPGVQRIVAPLEGGSHDQVGGSGSLQAARNR